MKESSDRLPLAPKKSEFFKLRTAAGVSGPIASHAFDASATAIWSPTTVPFLETLPVYSAKPEALLVDPPPQEYPHLKKLAETENSASTIPIQLPIPILRIIPAALRLGTVERDRWLMMPNKTAAAPGRPGHR